MSDEAFEAPEDPRLAKANAIVEYLRQNPSEAYRDTDDLAVQFGADSALVDRLLRSRIIQKKRKRAFSIKKLLQDIGSVIGRAVLGVTAQPVGFLIVVSLLFVIGMASSLMSIRATGNPGDLNLQGAPVAFGLAAYMAAQMLCLFVRPRFMYLLASIFLTALATGIVFAIIPMSHDLQRFRPMAAIAGGSAIGGLMGIVGAGFLLAGASLQVTIARNREAHLSRQDLLARMLDLQAQLAEMPPSEPRVPKRLLQQFRKSLFPWSGMMGFAFTVIAVGTDTRLREAGLLPTAQVPHAAYVSALVWLLVVCGFAFMAGTLKKGLILAVSMSLGSMAAYGLLFMTHRFPGLTLHESATRFGAESGYHALVIALVIYLVFLQRETARLRREGAPNEASIVAELMEVRDRLAAASVKVYVMAVDVVGSTKMKDRADPLLAEFSFRSYQSWTAEIAAKHGGKVDATTGDGAIVAFGTGQQALACTLELQSSMAEFNATKNRLSTPFQIRVALHAGLVVGELDKVQFAEVIDIAAHVEKLSPVGGFAATMDFLQDLAEPLQGVRQGPVVDGRQVYLCEPSEMAVPG